MPAIKVLEQAVWGPKVRVVAVYDTVERLEDCINAYMKAGWSFAGSIGHQEGWNNPGWERLLFIGDDDSSDIRTEGW